MSLSVHLILGEADQTGLIPVLTLALMQKYILNSLRTTSAFIIQEGGSSRN